MLRVNVGCGRHVIDGWVNVDAQRSPLASRDPEVLADALQIPLPDGCVEHLYHWQAPQALTEWHRLLMPGGLLVLEMPDVKKCARNLLAGTDIVLSLFGLYGDPREEDPFMTHKWGWTWKTVRKLLKRAGFVEIVETIPKWHGGGRELRDFRIEARKA